MSTITKKYTMNYFDAAENSNKVWIGMAYSDGTFETRFGRVREGANLAVKQKRLGSESAAIHALDIKHAEKLKKGYRDTSVLNESETQTIIAYARPAELGKIAVEQITGADACPTTAELIKYLAEVNIHQITASTSIRYNAATATFSTPLGILTPDAISEARRILSKIKSANEGGFSPSFRHSLICDYFRLVPADFGARIPSSAVLLDSGEKLQKQNSILDALDAAIGTAQTSTHTSADKIFACKLTKLPHWTDEGKAKFREIKALFEKTSNVHHSTRGLKLNRVYEVEIETMKANFDESAARLGNIRSDLWHGTKASNLLSILKNGLIIPKSSDAHCTGRMFGDGIYTSTQSTKALNYATNMWNGSGAANQKTFMFLCEAALGKMHEPKNRAGNFPKSGRNSTWIEAGTCGVLNNEVIVYDTKQINLKYLCEFSPA